MLSTAYTVTEDQLLTAKLYNTSVNPAIKKRRFFSWIMIPILYGVLGFIFYQVKGGKMIYFFVSFCILWIILYPFWEGNRFKKSYQNGLKRNPPKNLNNTQRIDFGEEINIYSGDHPENFSYDNLKSVVEIKSYFLLLFPNERTVVVPKEHFTEEIKTALKSKQIPFDERLNWRWK